MNVLNVQIKIASFFIAPTEIDNIKLLSPDSLVKL